MKHRILEHAVLTGGKASFTQTKYTLELHVPANDRDELDTIVKLVLDGPASNALKWKSP